MSWYRWIWKNPLTRALSRWQTLGVKALLMRKRSILLTITEIVVPVLFSFQIRLIFEPLALNIQQQSYRNTSEILYDFPQELDVRYTPEGDFNDKLMDRVAELLDIGIFPEEDEQKLVEMYYEEKYKEHESTMWVILKSDPQSKPEILEYDIRSQPETENENPSREDSYINTGFMAMQVAIESAFVEMWKTDDSFSPKKLELAQFPHYQIDFPILPSAVRPNISLIYYMTIVGFLLIPLATLNKVIEDKKTGCRALMRVLGINSTLLYLGWLIYIMMTGVPTCILCSLILSPVYSVNPITLFIFLLMFITVSALFVFALGTFFSHSVKAILACFLLWIFLAHLTITLDEMVIGESLFTKIVTLSLPHSGLIYGLHAFTSRGDITQTIEVLDTVEMRGGNATESLLNDSNTMSVELVLIGWACHIVGWYFVAIYLDNIYPGLFGTPKSIWYPLHFKTRPSDLHVTVRGSTNWSAVERRPKFIRPKVRVRKVTMIFGTVERLEVIKDMSIDFYENEFIIVLGHNGAGKSTLLRILTGMYQANSGRVYIEGRDYHDKKRSNKSERTIVSYCPQENVLVNYLSTLEHLILFGMLKGLSHKVARREATAHLIQFELETHRDSIIEKLTFGAKRRLCLAMALIGPSEVIVLDEPTWGVDPQHIKQIWEILATLKRKKTVIMATNSMEAADTLADRIAILANGRVECYGSKKYLSRRYGIGYELCCIMKSGYNLQLLRDSIQDKCQQLVTLTGKMGSMLRFNIPVNSNFPKLLNFLDYNKENLKIVSFTLKPASIEGQFRKIGLISQFKERGVILPDDKYEWIFQERRRHLIEGRESWTRLVEDELFYQQILAMFWRKLLHAAATWRPYLFSIMFSILTLILTMTVSGLSKFPRVHNEIVNLNASRYSAKNFFMLLYVNDTPDCQKFFESLKTSSDAHGMHNLQLTAINSVTSIMSHPELNSIQFRDRYFMAIDIFTKDHIRILYSPILEHSGPVSVNLYYNALLKHQTNNNRLEIKLRSRPIWDPNHWQYRLTHGKGVRNWENAAIVTTIFLLLPTADLSVCESRSQYKYLLMNNEGIGTTVYWLPTFLVDMTIYLISILITFLVTFGVYSDKLVLSLKAIGESLLIIFAYGASAISMGYCFQLCVRKTGTVLFLIMIVNLFTILTINPEVIFPLLMHYITTGAAQLMEILLHILPPYVLACAVGNFIGINLYNIECAVNNDCDNERAIEDPCCRNCGNQLCFKPLNVMLETNMDSFGFHAIAMDIFLLISQAVSFHLLLVFFEQKSRRKCRTLKLRGRKTALIDSDCKYEAIEINKAVRSFMVESSLPKNCAVIIKDLTKKYGKKYVLRDINIRINKQDCFGLIGMNGAGKSSIFQTLNGLTRARSGQIYLNNINYTTHIDEFTGMIGYCPQISGVADFLTGRQSLIFLAAIRGIPRANIRDEVDRWLDVFDLLEWENLQLKHCSFGVRRKIAVLQCLIGDLPVILLDEPSSGMDVIARGALGETLHIMRELGSSILFTTHYLDEVQALCNRVGILVDGSMVRIGSCEQLLSKYIDRFVMTLVLNNRASYEEIAELKLAVADALTDARFNGRYLDTLNYEFLTKISYDHVYEQLEMIKSQHPILTDFFVNHHSFEHIYYHVTKRDPKTHFRRLSFLHKLLQSYRGFL